MLPIQIAAHREHVRPVYELEALEQRYFLSAGFLDPNFADGGRLIEDRAQTEVERYVQMLVQSDGKILIGGTHDWGNVYIARYNADGTLDRDFSSDGVFNTSNISRLTAMRLQEDGKIVVAGWNAIERLNPDGSIDQAFGESGTVVLKQTFNLPNDILIQDDGKILVARYRAITALNSDGTPDLGFGRSGEVSNFGWGDNVVELRHLGNGFVALVNEWHRRDPDCYGRCYTPPPSYFLMRFDEQGNVDPEFGDGGFARPMTDDMEIENMEVAEDGRIIFLAGGGWKRDDAIYVYGSDGLPDARFGERGLDFDLPLDAYSSSMTLAHDGRIFIFGGQLDVPDLIVVRLNLDGTVDRTIGQNGIVPTGLKGSIGTVIGVEDDGGGLLLAGTFSDSEDWWNSQTHFFLARLKPDLTLPPQVPSESPAEPEGVSEDNSEDTSGDESGVAAVADDSLASDDEWGWIQDENFFSDQEGFELDDDGGLVWD